MKGMLDTHQASDSVRHQGLNAKPTVQHQFLCGSNHLALHNHTEILGHSFLLSLSEEDKAP